MLRSDQESAETIVAKKTVKAVGAKGRRTRESRQPTDPIKEGEESHEMPLERQLRQLPAAMDKGSEVDPRAALIVWWRARLDGGRRWQKMAEGEARGATLVAVLAVENLRAAWLAVKANDGAPGVDKMDMEQSARHLREHWETMRTKLLSGEYKPGTVRAVSIPKANGGERQLGIDSLPPPFPLALRVLLRRISVAPLQSQHHGSVDPASHPSSPKSAVGSGLQRPQPWLPPEP